MTIGMYALIADGILILHFGVIAFILAEQACIAIGFFRNWRWVRNLRFRVCHLLAIGVVAAQAWLGRLCPLTIWENALREAAGESPYPGTFIAHWFGALVYHDAPPGRSPPRTRFSARWRSAVGFWSGPKKARSKRAAKTDPCGSHP